MKQDNILFGLITFTLVLLMCVQMADASLGTFKQGDCVDIKTILNTSSVTLSTLNYPNGNVAVSEITMQNIAGKTFNYTYCGTNNLGTYIYDYYDTEGNVYVNDFEVTPTGVVQGSLFNNPVLLVLGIISMLLLILAFYMQSPTIGFIAGTLVMILGIYVMIYGFNNYTDLYTRTAGIVIICLGFIFVLAAGYEQIMIAKDEELSVSGNSQAEDE